MFLSVLCIVIATIGSFVAEYFSISGLTKLYSAGGPDIILLGATAATAGLVGIVWLHANWHNAQRGFFLKALVFVVLAGHVCLTNAGIFGRLSSDYLAESAPTQTRQVQLAYIQQQQQQDQQKLSDLHHRQEQLDALVQKYADLNSVSKAVDLRNSQKSERQSLQDQMTALQDHIAQNDKQSSLLQTSTTETETKLGPLRYVATFLGYSDPAVAERLLTLLIMLSFDPLNILLLIAGAGGLKKQTPVEVNQPQPQLQPVTPDQAPKVDDWFMRI